MEINALDWLQDFYYSFCDGEWEHGQRIRLSTLDNPGWLVKINLAETYLEDGKFKSVEIERTENDWLHCHIKDKSFVIACGPKNLTEGIGVFREWVEKQK